MLAEIFDPMARHAVSGVGLIVLWALLIPGLIFMFIRRRVSPEGEVDKRLAPRSRMGIAIQILGFGWLSFGPVEVTYSGVNTPMIVETFSVLLLGLATWGLFSASRAALADNWSLVARTRSDHTLVQAGPYAIVRHPIYLAILLWLLALAVALGHEWHLVLAVPIYIIGTLVRTSEEERLLHTMFGAAYEAYARRVKRFIPYVL